MNIVVIGESKEEEALLQKLPGVGIVAEVTVIGADQEAVGFAADQKRVIIKDKMTGKEKAVDYDVCLLTIIDSPVAEAIQVGRIPGAFPLNGISCADRLEKRSGTVAEGVTVPADEIKRVKGYGFLHNKGTNNFSARVITRNGKITAAESRYITEAAERFGNGNITMTTRMTLEIQGIPYENMDAFRVYIAQCGLRTGGTGAKVRPVVSCKGSTCQYGIIDTFAVSEAIHERFFLGYNNVKLPHKFKMAVGGCPNNCVKPDLNDVGVVGQRLTRVEEDLCRGCTVCAIEKECPMKAAKKVDGKLKIDPIICNHCGRCAVKCPFHAVIEEAKGCKIYIGGRWGKKVAHGTPLEKIFLDTNEVMDVLEKTILLFKEQGITGERLADTITRIGFENVQEQLLSNGLLERKDAILSKVD